MASSFHREIWQREKESGACMHIQTCNIQAHLNKTLIYLYIYTHTHTHIHTHTNTQTIAMNIAIYVYPAMHTRAHLS